MSIKSWLVSVRWGSGWGWLARAQLLEIPNLVTVSTYTDELEKFPIPDIRPAQARATAIIGSGFVRNLKVSIPFSDSRISNILAKKHQLSSDKSNIIILDLSTTGDFIRITKILEEIIHQEKTR